MVGYGVQLREKQKVKRTYGLLERQFRNYFREGRAHEGPDRRQPDGHAWSAGWIMWFTGWVLPVRARRLASSCSHGHIRIKGHKVNIPSYLVQVGDEVALKENMHQNAMVLEARNLAQSQGVAPWLDIDRAEFQGARRGAAASRGRADAADERAADRRTCIRSSAIFHFHYVEGL